MATSEPSTLPLGGDALPAPAAAVAAMLLAPLRAVAFWSAVALPLVYLPLIATGAVWDRPLAFCAMLLLNGVAFLAGHSHDPKRA